MEEKTIKWRKVYLTLLSSMPVYVHQKAHTGRFLSCSQNILYKIHLGFMPYMPYLYFDTGLQPESSENRNILLPAHNITVSHMAFLHSNTRLVRFSEASDQLFS